jgi:chloramphenicol 3-O phosphotransferase
LFGAYFARLSAIARAGSDVVADLGLHRDFASGFDPMPMLTAALDGLDLLMVGIDCALPVIMARRNADPQNGLYAAGPGVPAPVARWQVAVHDGKHYDLRLDMGVLTPQQGAARIAEILFYRASLNLR